MLSLKQRVGEQWDSEVDMDRVAKALPPGWTIQDLGQHLRWQPLFQDRQRIPDNYLLHLIAASSLVSLMPGATVLHEGAYGRDLYILLEGQLSASSQDISGQELPVTIFNPGEHVGEYGMLTGQPYTTTVRAQDSAQILRVPEQVMQHLMELVPSTRDFFSQLNNARSLEGILKRLALFQGVANDDMRGLAGQTQIKHYERNERLFTENRRGQPARETLHVLLEGFVKVARHDKQNESEERVIAYRQGGDYFAGGLDLLGDGKAVTVTAITRTRVAEVPRQALLALFQMYPEVDQRFALRLRDYLESTASAHSGVFEPGAFTQYIPSPVPTDEAARVGLHSLVSDGVVEGTEVLVIDLDKCIHCNECEEACARRHGHSRMNRKGMVIGNISITTTCRQCQDPVCMLCSRAGIARLPNGEVYITESCIGCGICAERCPYGAISIVNVDESAEADTPSWQRFSNFFTKGAGKERARKSLPMANTASAAPVASAENKLVASGPLNISKPHDAYEEMRKKIAIKCDLCAGYSDQACVQACPPGAAIRVKPTMFFGSTEEILRR
jgi:CRP-like cAMP-binding protein/Fe-S-cluster-containing hydrogenase component 2